MFHAFTVRTKVPSLARLLEFSGKFYDFPPATLRDLLWCSSNLAYIVLVHYLFSRTKVPPSSLYFLPPMCVSKRACAMF